MRIHFHRTTDPHMTPPMIIFQIAVGTFSSSTGFVAFRFMRQKLNLFTTAWIVVNQRDMS